MFKNQNTKNHQRHKLRDYVNWCILTLIDCIRMCEAFSVRWSNGIFGLNPQNFLGRALGCRAITLELSEKSKMATKMAAVTAEVSVLTRTPSVFRLYSQFLVSKHMFSNTENSLKPLSQFTATISREIKNLFVNNPKIKSHLSSVMMFWIIQNIWDNMNIMEWKWISFTNNLIINISIHW